MSRALRIYVSGPYSAPTLEEKEANVDKAIKVAISLYKKGHHPFTPHLSHFVDICTETLKWEDYMQCDIAWLSVADAMLFMGHSPGADLELIEAKRLGLKIFYNVDEVYIASLRLLFEKYNTC